MLLGMAGCEGWLPHAVPTSYAAAFTSDLAGRELRSSAVQAAFAVLRTAALCRVLFAHFLHFELSPSRQEPFVDIHGQAKSETLACGFSAACSRSSTSTKPPPALSSLSVMEFALGSPAAKGSIFATARGAAAAAQQKRPLLVERGAAAVAQYPILLR